MTFPVPVTLNLFAALLTVFRFTDISPNFKKKLHQPAYLRASSCNRVNNARIHAE